MKKNLKTWLALLLAAAMLFSTLTACGSSSSDTEEAEETTTEETAEETEEADEAEEEETEAEEAEQSEDNAITDYIDYRLVTEEMSTFLIQYGESGYDLYVLTNLYDGLLTNDTDGNLAACLAESWGTDDNGLTWTFNLRQDACWVDVNGEKMADLTSADFVTSMEWILNAWKNEGANTSMLIEMIDGAEEYYSYTSSLTEEEALALEWNNEYFLETVGIETPDDYTVVYHCLAEKPYFDSVATYCCLYPLCAELIEQVGVENMAGLDNTEIWYSGPYLMTEYIYQNEKVYEPNPLWWGADENTRFDSITTKMVESLDVAFQMYQTGELDYVELSESNLSIIYNDPDNEYYDYLVQTRRARGSYALHWNYSKMDADGNPDENWNKAVANEAFRLSWYYGLDLTTYWQRTNAINPLDLESNAYTMWNLCFTSDGTDYVELVLDKLGLPASNDGETPARLNTELAEEYKQQAIEELTELGVTFPISIDYYVSASDQTEQDTANVFAQLISDCLGDDYVVLNICTYVSSFSQEVRIPQLQSIYISSWGADYADPQNFLVQETYGNESAYMSVYYSNVEDLYDCTDEYRQDLIASLEEYTALVETADAITEDLDARYEAFAEAEAYLISHGLSIPWNYNITWELTKVNDYSKIYSIYGIQMKRYLNYETNADGYTTADYEAFAAEAAG